MVSAPTSSRGSFAGIGGAQLCLVVPIAADAAPWQVIEITTDFFDLMLS
jgi:hypothetical protein